MMLMMLMILMILMILHLFPLTVGFFERCSWDRGSSIGGWRSSCKALPVERNDMALEQHWRCNRMRDSHCHK